ncbi:MAG: uncharacterized protein QOE15_2880 [Acidimicrobiaceae bacterium]|nr:uncharacterized protein [Acidimicrobiaceae bacterium]
MALRAQGLLGRGSGPRDPAAVLRQVLALQLDTISVLARSHELVCYARVGAVGRAAVEAACWGTDGAGAPVAVEYWAHAACIMPIEMWPWFAFRRRKLARHPRWGGYVNGNPAVGEVLKRLTVEGPLTASDLGGSKNGGPWWDWSPTKVAVERLLDLGEVICTTRRGWKRVYDLTERVLPPRVAALGEPPDEECWRTLVAMAGRALGVATVKDLAEYFRLRVQAVAAAVADSGLVAVTVDGWDGSGGAGRAWADPVALAALGARGRHRTTLVSPFDSLIWDRPRTARLFGYTHRIEAYTPSPQRVHGYYVMPVLAGGRLVGRVDPKRVGKTLVARQVSLVEPWRPEQVQAVSEALREAAAWVGCDAVAIERCDTELLGPLLRAAIESA